MTRLDPFEHKLSTSWPPTRWANNRILVAFSGGPDSGALLRSLHALNPAPDQLLAAHFNHRLRGTQSDQDQQFVQKTCRSLGLDCEIAQADPSLLAQTTNGQGLESAARQARYRFLIETAESQGAPYLVT